jgi:hypothetical protein
LRFSAPEQEGRTFAKFPIAARRLLYILSFGNKATLTLQPLFAKVRAAAKESPALLPLPETA